MTPNPAAPAAPQGWFSRNWKWLVPVGCLVPMLCCGTFGAVTYFGASKMIQSSGVFTTALMKASANKDVQATLGTPLTPGLGMNGGFEEKNGRGTADFSMPLEGPKGKGTLVVKATGAGGEWTYETLEIEAGGKRINLLEGEAPAPSRDRPADDAPPPDAQPEEPAPEEPEGD